MCVVMMLATAVLINYHVAQLVTFGCCSAEFRRLAPRYPNTVVIDRDGMEFHTREGLTHIMNIASLPPFREIPYRRMERYPNGESKK